MQQLNKWRFCSDTETILYVQKDCANWDNFNRWCDTFCVEHFCVEHFCLEKLSLISLEQGADRQQMHFRLGEYDYLLCYESMCEALWIDSIGQQACAALDVLCKLLDRDIHDGTNHL